MEEIIQNTVKVLKSGKTILYPTDTIWGIGCDATSTRAVDKVYRLKRRVENKSLIILLDDLNKISKYVSKVPDILGDLLQSIDAPITVIYPNAKNLAKNLIAADGTIAIRITSDHFCREMIKEFGKPVVSTSANISGQQSPIIFGQVSDEIKKGVDFIAEIHTSRISKTKPSTIIKLDVNGNFKIIRD